MEETRRERPYLDFDPDNSLRQAYALYENYTLKNQPLPAEELASLRRTVKAYARIQRLSPESFSEYSRLRKKFNSFRSAIGEIAFQKKGAVDSTVAIELIRIIFGERDARLLRNVVALSKASAFAMTRYIPDDMFELYQHISYFVVNDKTTADEKKRLMPAIKDLGQFLTTLGNEKIERKAEIITEMMVTAGTYEDIYYTFLRDRTKYELKSQLDALKEEKMTLWKRFQSCTFEVAPASVNRLLFLKTAIEEISFRIKNKKKIAKSLSEATAMGNHNQERILAASLQRLATELHRKAAEPSADSAKEHLRANGYESEAESIIRGISEEISASEVPREQH